MVMNNSYSFLVIGKTQESKETQDFKRYIGLGSSYVIAVNPTKKELETIYGREVANDPEYLVNTERGKEARITFIVKTDPETNNGIEIINRVMFTLRNSPAYNRDQSKVQVIDKFGNSVWANTEDAKAGNKLPSSTRIDSQYRIACVGEADLIGFLKAFLCIKQGLKYVNGEWLRNDNPEDYFFELQHIKDYFSGDFSEIKEAINYQPNNKVKLLYGVRTTDEGKQYQTVATRYGMILPNNATAKTISKLEEDLLSSKEAGSYATTEFKVQELAEYVVEPTNFNSDSNNLSTASSSDDMPWD